MTSVVTSTGQMFAHLLETALACPPARTRGPEGRFIVPVRSDGTMGEWDWYWSLSDANRTRYRRYMSADPNACQPDQWAHTMGYEDTEPAMGEWMAAVDAQGKRDEWEDEPEDLDGWQRRTLECTDEEWAEVTDWIIRRREMGVSPVEGGMGSPVVVPGSLALVGLADIARMAGVNSSTMRMRYRRGSMPTPLESPSGRPVWERSTIVKWLESRKDGRTA